MIDHNLLVTSGYLVPGVFNSFLLNYKADYFQKIIVYLSQDFQIFDGTIRENILFDRNVPDDEIMMALEKENLSAWFVILPGDFCGTDEIRSVFYGTLYVTG